MTGTYEASRLVALAGPMSGEVFPLDADAVTVGRDAGNAVSVPDAALSRRHCVFAREDRVWWVRDLGSSNGTFVNGIPISAHALAEGDRISIGGSVLLFVRTTRSDPPPVELVDCEQVTPTTQLAVGETVYLKRAPPAASRVEHGLRALLQISTLINALRSEDVLHAELLALLAEVVPVEAAAIVLPRGDSELQVVEARAGGAPLAISRTLVRRVLEEHAGVLSRDVPPSRGGESATLSPANVRALLCVPMAVRDTVLGVIYLVSREHAAFDDEHLQLVTAVARIAAIVLENVRHMAALEREAERLQADLVLGHNIIGTSAPMQRVYERLARVAHADTTALITGETGTGKELAARAIHLNSSRARRPFVAVNCATLNESLLEADLFGHEKGAFTGALGQKKGRIELAEGGTLFLDEIGELAPGLQAKLLRVLQEREFERVGGIRPIKVDIRVVSATNRALAEEVRAGRFRQDLFFRLNVVTIDLPALRERRSDVGMLARHFLNRYAPKAGRRVWEISPAALACMTAYDWPGNVRELENAIERAVVLGTTPEILAEDLPENIVDAATTLTDSFGQGTFHTAVREARKAAIVGAFRAAGGSYTEAAHLLGIHPNYLHRLIKNLGLKATLKAEA